MGELLTPEEFRPPKLVERRIGDGDRRLHLIIVDDSYTVYWPAAVDAARFVVAVLRASRAFGGIPPTTEAHIYPEPGSDIQKEYLKRAANREEVSWHIAEDGSIHLPLASLSEHRALRDQCVFMRVDTDNFDFVWQVQDSNHAIDLKVRSASPQQRLVVTGVIANTANYDVIHALYEGTSGQKLEPNLFASLQNLV